MYYKELDVYKLSIELSDLGWSIYKNIPKNVMYELGNQLFSALDSVGANIAEGYGRYHYADRLRFYYFARGSLCESEHWIELLYKRNLISKEDYSIFSRKYKNLSIKLNNYITSFKSDKQSNITTV